MAIAVATTLLSLVAVATLLASLWLWLVAAARVALSWNLLPVTTRARVEVWLVSRQIPPRLPLVPWSERRAVPWAIVDLLLLGGIWVLASLIVQSLMSQLDWSADLAELDHWSPAQRMALIAGNLGVSLGILIVGLPLIAWRTGGTVSDFGLNLASLKGDFKLGLSAFAMLAPPVYLLQGLLVTFWKPSKHPLMEMFKSTPDAPFFALLFVSAAVIAPLFEELLFRVTLQGLLEKLFSFRYPLESSLIGGPMHQDNWQRVLPGDVESDLGDQEVPSAPTNNPYSPPVVLGPLIEQPAFSPIQPELCGLSAGLPIAGSSAVFALLHYSHGPDWIPLLLLAGGMGYLNQRTHRLVPSLTVHALLNALSMCALWVQVHTDK